MNRNGLECEAEEYTENNNYCVATNWNCPICSKLLHRRSPAMRNSTAEDYVMCNSCRFSEGIEDFLSRWIIRLLLCNAEKKIKNESGKVDNYDQLIAETINKDWCWKKCSCKNGRVLDGPSRYGYPSLNSTKICPDCNGTNKVSCLDDKTLEIEAWFYDQSNAIRYAWITDYRPWRNMNNPKDKIWAETLLGLNASNHKLNITARKAGTIRIVAESILVAKGEIDNG